MAVGTCVPGYGSDWTIICLKPQVEQYDREREQQLTAEHIFGGLVNVRSLEKRL